MPATKFDRAFLKSHFPELISFIQARHEIGPEVEHELYVNHTPVVGLCHQRGYFMVCTQPGKPDLYIQYAMDHIIKDVALKLIGRAVMEVTIYDTYQEYESDRIKAMSSVAHSDQTGINLN